MSGIEVRLRPHVAADWLARDVLPGLLGLCERDAFAESLAEREPLVSPANLGDSYVMARLASSLRGVRAGLVQQLEFERRWMRDAGVPGTVARFGGPVVFRDRFFPGLDAVTGFVERTVPARNVGLLLRQCVELAIELVIASRDNSDTAVAANGSLALMRVYDDAVTRLAGGGAGRSVRGAA